MSDKKFSEFTLQTDSSNVAFVVGFNGSDNVRISPSNLIGSGFLPTSGGTMTGNLLLQDNIQVQVGTGGDLKLYHNGTDSFIENQTGILKIQSSVVGGDISFLADNGSGTPTEYFRLDGGDTNINFQLDTLHPDNVKAKFGTSADLRIYHNGTNSNIENFTGTLQIIQNLDDGDISFRCDDGSGGTAEYFRLDGGNGNIITSVNNVFADDKKVCVGSSADLQIVHNGTDSQINNLTGNLQFTQLADDKDISFASDNGSGGDTIYLTLDGSAGYTTAQKDIRFDDGIAAAFGTGVDAFFKHDGSNFNFFNDTGNVTFTNRTDDGDISFICDDGSGGVAEYFRLDGGATNNIFSKNTKFGDSVEILVGDGNDLHIYHNGSDSYVSNDTGDLYIRNSANDKDVIFQSDDGSGGMAAYITLDGSAEKILMHKSTVFSGGGMDYGIDGSGADVIFYGDTSGRNMKWDQSEDHLLFTDSTKLKLGTSGDLEIYHDGSHSYIKDAGTGNLQILATNLQINNSGNTQNMITASDGGAVTLYTAGNAKLATTSSGVDITGRMAINDGNFNILIGDNAGDALSSGTRNIAVGHNALSTEDGHGRNVAVGHNSLFALDAGADAYNVAVGYDTGVSITTGTDNTIIGGLAGDALTTGALNVAVGKAALSSEDTGSANVAIGHAALMNQNYNGNGYNTAVGHNAGTSVTTGIQNTLIGALAGDNLAGGSQNVAVGMFALSTEDTHGKNVAIGYSALVVQNAGADAYNTAVGYNAGGSVTTGVENVLIGGLAGDALTTGHYNVAIGMRALSSEDAHGFNIAIGRDALKNQNAGANAYNVAMGYQAGLEVTTGVQNTIIGGLAGDALTTGERNTAIGHAALGTEDTGSRNTAFGWSALTTLNYDGSGYNTAMGYAAGMSVTTGTVNTLIGGLAGQTITTGAKNTALGYQALTSNADGSNSTAIGYRALLTQDPASAVDMNNVAVGHDAGLSVSTGVENVLIGALAGDALTTGQYNVVLGTNALSAEDTGSRNTAIGHAALFSLNYNGAAYNTAVGFQAGLSVTTGTLNTIIGGLAGKTITTGTSNVLMGYEAAEVLLDGGQNTLLGDQVSGGLTSGSENTYIGRRAASSATTGSNNLSIGAGSSLSSATVSNEANIFNGSVVARFQGAASAWTFVSDERDKKDIEDLELGLDFIDKLKPRKFKWDLRDSDTDKGKESSGFIAQEIKEVLDETGVDYTGIVDTNNPDQYTVAQANIIPMLVKAIQELKQEIQQLKNK